MTSGTSNEIGSQNISKLLIGIWRHLSSRRRIQLCILLLVVLASGVAEMVSLGALIPFLTALSNPDQLVNNPIVDSLSRWVGFKSSYQILPAASILFAVAVVSASLVRLANLWLDGRLVAAVGSDLSCESYRRTLYQPYEFHIQQNSSKVITNATTQIAFTVVSLKAFLRLVSSLVVSVSIFSALLLVNAIATLSSAFLFFAAYCFLLVVSRQKLKTNSKKIAFASRRQIKALQEGLGAIRDVILDSSQSEFLKIYKENDTPQRRLQAQNGFIINSPRYVLEAFGLVIISLWGGFLVNSGGSSEQLFPLLGALALGAQRLLPALQQIYNGWSTLNANSAAIADVLEILNQPLPGDVSICGPFPLRYGIQLKNVAFGYNSKNGSVIKCLNIKIERGEFVGIIGSTGSGKSTTVDLIMGLLSPTSGQVLVDGIDINFPGNLGLLRSWRSSVAHVPQSIYLSDCSIAENIAFGVPNDEIDFNRVISAAERAQIADFINSCPERYRTIVGERGVGLSGGQRQRLGLARAFYKRSQILVLDEATSALDIETEASVLNSINEYSKSMTVVMIAHRLSTIMRCDRVIKMSNGLVTADGPPLEVLSGSD